MRLLFDDIEASAVVGEVVRREEGGFAVQFSQTSKQAQEILAALVAAAFDPHLVSIE